MTLEQCKDRVDSIRIVANKDKPYAQELAAELYRDVLEVIADGSDDFEALAEIALQAEPFITQAIDRWYA